jgi:hypothetical protein
MIFPLTKSISLSNSAKISDEGWWIVETIFTPLLLKCFKSSTTYKAVELSNPVVGSSKNTILGFVSNSTPIEVLFLSPPETPLIKLFPILVLAQSYRPSSMIKLSTFYFFYSAFNLGSLRLATNINASLGVKVGNKISSYIT